MATNAVRSTAQITIVESPRGGARARALLLREVARPDGVRPTVKPRSPASRQPRTGCKGPKATPTKDPARNPATTLPWTVDRRRGVLPPGNRKPMRPEPYVWTTTQIPITQGRGFRITHQDVIKTSSDRHQPPRPALENPRSSARTAVFQPRRRRSSPAIYRGVGMLSMRKTVAVITDSAIL